MARAIVHPLQEILARDINNFRKSSDKTLLDIVLGNALPKIPAFISDGFKVSISGNDVSVKAGICFQNIDQTDGSANTRIAHLEMDTLLTINLPSGAGVTKVDLVECRSVLVNLPEESRRFNEPGGVISRNTVTQNKWSAEVRVRENVTANPQGGYDASEGWVACGLVRSNNVTIDSVEDLRDFYNIFDPDFFSVYGRKNINFHKNWDGINLVEVPFEFSDLVTKLSQVSVRRLTKEKFGLGTITTSYDSGNLTLNKGTGTSTGIKPLNQLTFLGDRYNIANLNDITPRSPINYDFLFSSSSNWNTNARFNPQSMQFSISTSNRGNFPIILSSKNGLNALRIQTITLALFNQIGTDGIYILLSQNNNIGNSYIVWQLRKIGLEHDDSNNSLNSTSGWSDYIPIAKSADFESSFNKAFVTTVSPLAQLEGSYILSALKNITNFYQLETLTYNPNIRQLKFTLKDTTSGITEFPLQGRVFNIVKFKKGTETRLTLNITELTVSLPTMESVGSITRDATKDISLETGNLINWEGATSDGTTIWFIRTFGSGGNNIARAYNASTRARDSAKDITLSLTGQLRGAVSDGTTLWFIHSTSGTPSAIAYNASTRARDSAKDISLGVGDWQSGVSDGTTLWFINNGNNNAIAYNASTRARDSSKDITLGSGVWYGATSDRTTLWFISSGNTNVIAYNASTRARDSSKDITVPIATYRGAIFVNNTIFFIQESNGYRAIAYSVVPETQTGNQAEYTYNLTSQDTLIKGTDTVHNDWSLEFDVLSSTGEDIWRANILRGGTTLGPNVDFVIVTEGNRTYVRLNGQFPFKVDDELIFSHIIPQALIDAGSGGTPEAQDANTQISSLRDQVNALTRRVSTNEGDISTLENASVAGDVVFYYGIVSVAGGRTSTARANAKRVAYLTPFVTAGIASAVDRTEKTVSSLSLGGGLVQYNTIATIGYYSPWVAIETADIGNGSLYVLGPNGDESDLWRPAGSATLNSKAYTLYVRTTPLVNSKSLRVVFRVYR